MEKQLPSGPQCLDLMMRLMRLEQEDVFSVGVVITTALLAVDWSRMEGDEERMAQSRPLLAQMVQLAQQWREVWHPTSGPGEGDYNGGSDGEDGGGERSPTPREEGELNNSGEGGSLFTVRRIDPSEWTDIAEVILTFLSKSTLDSGITALLYVLCEVKWEDAPLFTGCDAHVLNQEWFKVVQSAKNMQQVMMELSISRPLSRELLN